jgi:hypothetical protein
VQIQLPHPPHPQSYPFLDVDDVWPGHLSPQVQISPLLHGQSAFGIGGWAGVGAVFALTSARAARAALSSAREEDGQAIVVRVTKKPTVRSRSFMGAKPRGRR